MADLTFDYVEGRKKTSQKETRMTRIRRAEKEAPERIAKRGSILSGLISSGRDVIGGGKEGKLEQAKDIGKFGLNVLSAPVQAVEGAIAAPLLKLQEDPTMGIREGGAGGFVKRVGETGISSLMGLTGKEQPRFEDIYLGAGMGETGAKIAGLGTTLAIPVAVVNKLSKTMGALTTVTDRKLASASKLAVSAGDEAANIVGQSVDDAFAPVNNVVGDGAELRRLVTTMPKILQKAFIDKFGGNIDDVLASPVVGRLREMKQWLGKLKSASFGKRGKGLEENLMDEAVNTVYGGFKKLIRKAAESKVGKDGAKLIDDADDAYSRLLDAVNVIKKGVVDPQLPKEFTKGGLFARQLMGVKGTARKATEIVRKAGPDAARQIKEANRLLKRFEMLRVASGIGKGVLKGAAIGGGFAGISRLLGRNSQGETTVVSEPGKQ